MALPGQESLTRADLRRAVGGLRVALGWGFLFWLILLLAHMALRYWFVRAHPEFVLRVWATTLSPFLQVTLSHLFAMRLVLLLLALAWLIVWQWEKHL